MENPERPGEHSRQGQEERRIPSAELFQGRQAVLIQHGKEVYRLLITKAGKLILNK